MSVLHTGGCHCGAVGYEVETDLEGLVECNCSHCYRKGLVLGFVSPDAFRVTADGPQTEYLFNTHKITHLFCETCGVQSFARGTAPARTGRINSAADDAAGDVRRGGIGGWADGHGGGRAG